MSPPPVRLALLWHMHQPYYLDPDTGESILPWVRLHALKDYWGMVAAVRAVPGMHVTFNLVPSLVEQVEAYALERTWDRHLVVGLAEAASVPAADAEWFVREGFHAHAPTMIRPYPRYAELAGMSARGAAFAAGDLRDLQVWQKLAWVDPDYLVGDERASRLVGKGRDFDEHDKATLRAIELEILRQVIPAYRAAADSGAVELSTSPYLHPILPLLCDSAAHHAAHPTAPLPDPPFRHPEDAALQLTRAIAAHRRWFGRAPAGVWPSEGSVSDAAASEIARAGFRWTASDEAILARSVGPVPFDAGAPCQPHGLRTTAGELRVLFREHALSDLIGFTYQGWDAEAATADFLARVREVGRRAAAHGVATPVVPVILDGENAWEHYAGGGRPFLGTLYQAVVAAPDLVPVTMSVAAGGPARPLSSIFAGSWINADFGVWIGHRDDRRAWELLGETRAHYASRGQADAGARAAALDAVLAAEGSDWCWWYGDDHSSAHDREFDGLFRRHLARVYSCFGDPVPEVLHRSIITTRVELDDHLRPGPVDVGGDPASYFARAAAVSLEGSGGVMHRDAAGRASDARVGVTAQGLAVFIELNGAGLAATLEVRRSLGEAPAEWRLDGPTIVPWTALGAGPGDDLFLRIVVRDRSGHVCETVPAEGVDRILEVPDAHLDERRWRT